MRAEDALRLALILTLPATVAGAVVLKRRWSGSSFALRLLVVFNAAALVWFIALGLIRDPCGATPLPPGCDPDPVLPYWSEFVLLAFVIPWWLVGNFVLAFAVLMKRMT